MFVFVACLNACVCRGGVSMCLVAPSSDLGYREMVEREGGQSVCVWSGGANSCTAAVYMTPELTALDPLGNLPERNAAREEEGKHVSSMCSPQRNSTVSITCQCWIECICVRVTLMLQCWCFVTVWSSLHWFKCSIWYGKSWKRHMTAAVGWSFMVHVYMGTLWLYCMYSMISRIFH